MSVTTINARIKPEELGITLVHEHLHQNFRDSFKRASTCQIDSNLRLTDMAPHEQAMARYYPYHFYDNLDLTDFDAVRDDLVEFRRLGGGAVCEVSSSGERRDPAHVAKLSRQTGLHIVMGTTYYPSRGSSSIEQVADFIRREIDDGFVGSEGRYYPGLIGEVECVYPLTPHDRRHLQAVACQPSTMPISLHPGRHREAPGEIARLLLEAGACERKISMGHLDRTLLTIDELTAFADEFNVYMQFDLFGIENSYYQMAPVLMPNDGQRLNLMAQLIKHDCAERLMVSNDIWRKNRLLAYGGQGYGHVLRTVTPMALDVARIEPDKWSMILRDNPQRWLDQSCAL